MELLAKKVNSDYQDMFTPGKFYTVEQSSPNGKMVLITLDNGLPCHVVYQTSVYGEFELVE